MGTKQTGAEFAFEFLGIMPGAEIVQFVAAVSLLLPPRGVQGTAQDHA
jgi:hypothetical protein